MKLLRIIVAVFLIFFGIMALNYAFGRHAAAEIIPIILLAFISFIFAAMLFHDNKFQNR